MFTQCRRSDEPQVFGSLAVARHRGCNASALMLNGLVCLSAVLVWAPVAGAAGPAAAPTLVASTASGSHYGARYATACACHCCFRGDCVAVPNTTHNVATCSECTMSSCETQFAELILRMQQTDGENRLGGGLVGGSAVVRSPCLALTSLELSACAGDSNCRRSTSLKALCVDRGEAFQKYSCLLWLLCVVGLIGAAAARRAHAYLDRFS
jgi:hypothetical protein